MLLLHALGAVVVGAGGRVGRAGHGIGLGLVVTVGREAVRGGAGAGSRSGSRGLLAQVDEAVDKAVLRGEVREVVVDGQAVGHRWCDVRERSRGGGLVRDGRICVRVGESVAAEDQVAFWQGRELWGEGGVDSADGQVARIAEVKILRWVFRCHRIGVGSGRGRKGGA